MKLFLMILGALQMIAGVFIAISAASAIHEILGATAFGLGTIGLGIAILIDRVERIGQPTTSAASDNHMDLTGKKGGSWRAQ